MKTTSKPVMGQEVVPFARRGLTFFPIPLCCCFCIIAGIAIGANEDKNASGGDVRTMASDPTGGQTASSSAILVFPRLLDDGSIINGHEEIIANLSPDELCKLQRLIVERNAFRADMDALGRLSTEQIESIRKIDVRFANEYGIRPDRQYSYDADKMTVFLVSEDPRHGGSAEQPALLPHRAFPTDAEANAFLLLRKTKEEAINARNVFENALVKRREAYRAVLAKMQADFKLSQDHASRLEAATRAEKAVVEKTHQSEIQAKFKKLETEHAAELQAAREGLDTARKERDKAATVQMEAQNDFECIKANKKHDSGAIAVAKERLVKSRKEMKDADNRVTAAERTLKKLEKALTQIKDDAEREAKAAMKEEERKARIKAEEKAAAEKKAKAEEERKAAAEKKAKAEEERRARIEAEEKAAAEKKAKAEEERRARIEAEEKAAAEKKAKAEEERKARIEAEEKAIASEKALLDTRIQELDAKYKADLESAVAALTSAEGRAVEARKAVASARVKYDTIRSDKASSAAKRDAARAGVVFAENQLEMSERECEKGRRTVAEVQTAISRIEKDVRKAYADELRAQGRKPLTYSTGLFGF